ncbi:MAG: hypothetical protein SFV32_00460 [Opitutaceae bacterium]|nr:hypothetical protein [Opitutaceae bacterium]
MKLHHLVPFAAGVLALTAVTNAKPLKLTTWSSAGDVVLNETSAGLTTAHGVFEDDFPAAAGAFNASGNNPLESFDLESQLGLTSGSLDLDPTNGVNSLEGSAIWGLIDYKAGQTLKFNWKLFTNETFFNDYAFVVLNGVVMPFVNASAATVPSAPFQLESSSGKFHYTFTESGTAKFAVGVVDVGDYSASSRLDVSSFSVPEGGSLAPFFALLLGTAAWVRRRIQA